MTRFRVRDLGELRRRVKSSRREVVVVPYSVRTLAEEVGVNRSTIGYLISGKRPVVNEAIAKGVAEALQVSLDELFVPEHSQDQEREDDAAEEAS